MLYHQTLRGIALRILIRWNIMSYDSSDKDLDPLEGLTFEVDEVDEIEDAGKRLAVRRKGVYLLPNLFTTSALFFGFYAVIASMNGLFEKGAVAIFIAMILDGLDGRVARLTHTQSAFGAEYDSLSDLVAFGVAPATLLYAWNLSLLGKVGWMAAFIFTACAALRLARFNTQVETADKRYFTGLPSPAAAAVITAFVWMSYDTQISHTFLPALSAVLIVCVAALMVSNIKYNSFKKLDFRGRVPFMVIFLAMLTLAVIFIDTPKMLLFIFGLYALSGPAFLLKKKIYPKRMALRGNVEELNP